MFNQNQMVAMEKCNTNKFICNSNILHCNVNDPRLGDNYIVYDDYKIVCVTTMVQHCLCDDYNIVWVTTTTLIV